MKKTWIKLLNREASLPFSVDLVLSNRDLLLEEIGYSIKNFWYDSVTYAVYYVESEILGLGQAIEDKIKSDPEFIKRNIEECFARGRSLLKISEKVNKGEMRSDSNQELIKYLREFRKTYLNFLPYATYPHSIERHIIISIKKELGNMLSQNRVFFNPDQTYDILTTPTDLDLEQQIDLYKAAQAVTKKRDRQAVEKEALHLREKYGYMPFWSLTASLMPVEYYANELISLQKQKLDFDKEIEKLKQKKQLLRHHLSVTLDQIKATPLLKDLVGLLQKYIYLRTYRKNIISKSHFNHIALLKEIGNRLKIGELVFYMSYEEMITSLQSNRLDRELIKKRKGGYAVAAFGGKLQIIGGHREVISALNKLKKKVAMPIGRSLTEVAGRVACRGHVRASACVVMSIKEIDKVKKGSVLVTPMTTPEFTPVLKKLAAIITDEGGVSCHASIVSREFGIPCIVGCQYATKIFKDGDLLEVDAEKGICKKL